MADSTKHGLPGIYNATAPTLADGQGSALGVDVNQNVKTTMETLLSGENETKNRMMVMPAYLSSGSITTDTLVVTGSGYVHTITFSCDDAAPTAGSFTLFDNTAESGTEIFSHTFTTTAFLPVTIILDTPYATGLYAGFTTTADVNVVISYI